MYLTNQEHAHMYTRTYTGFLTAISDFEIQQSFIP